MVESLKFSLQITNDIACSIVSLCIEVVISTLFSHAISKSGSIMYHTASL